MSTTDLVQGGRIRSLAAVMASVFAVGLVVGMTGPLIALQLNRQGWGPDVIGYNAAVYSAAMLATGFVIPRLVFKLGVVVPLVGGLILGAAALSTMPFVGGIVLLFVLRVVLAIGNGIDWVVSETWVNVLATGPTRGRVIGIYTTIFSGGLAAGPLLLSVVGAGDVAFHVASGLLVLGTLPILLAAAQAPDLQSGSGGAGAGPISMVAVLPVPLILAMLGGFGETSVLAIGPVYLTSIGFDETRSLHLLAGFAAGTFLTQPLIGWLADKVGRLAMQVGLALTALVSLTLVPLSSGAFLPSLIGLFIAGGALGGFYTAGLVYLGRDVDQSTVAAGNSAFVMSYTGGMIAGPALSGAAMGAWVPHGFMVPTLILLSGFAAVAATLRR